MAIKTDLPKIASILVRSPLATPKSTPPTLNQVHHIVIPLMLRAGQILVSRQKELTALAVKDRLDHAKMITREIAELFRTTIPQILSGHVVYEAGEAVPVSEWRWILQPLEGERAYAQGLSRYACSLALQHRGEIAIAMVLEPATELVVYAIKGEGAFLNDQPIHVSETKHLREAVVSVLLCAQPSTAMQKSYTNLLSALLQENSTLKVDGTRLLGLLQLANGAIDAMVIYPEAGAVSRLAAGLFVAKEAGAIVSDGEGKPIGSTSSMIVAAPASIAKTVLLAMRTKR